MYKQIISKVLTFQNESPKINFLNHALNIQTKVSEKFLEYLKPLGGPDKKG